MALDTGEMTNAECWKYHSGVSLMPVILNRN